MNLRTFLGMSPLTVSESARCSDESINRSRSSSSRTVDVGSEGSVKLSLKKRGRSSLKLMRIRSLLSLYSSKMRPISRSNSSVSGLARLANLNGGGDEGGD